MSKNVQQWPKVSARGRRSHYSVDVDDEVRKATEITRVPIGGICGVLPGLEGPQADIPLEFEDHWTGGYIFENEWQSFRSRRQRELELVTAEHSYDRPGRYVVAVKVIDIFGNDTKTLLPVGVG